MTHELKRVMGLPAGIASAVGLVVASTTLVLQGQGFGMAGPGFLIAMVVAMLVNLFAMFSFAELSGIMPRAGSINHYTQAALGPFMAIVAVVASYFIPVIFAGSVEASIPGIIGLLGLGGGTPVESSLGSFNPLGWSVFSLVALGFWLFVGAEFVTTLAEEIKKPKVCIPLSMFLGLLIIFVAGGLYGLASLKYVTAKELASSRTPHVDLATALLGRIGQVWMSLASILASATTMNTVLCALPRMLYGMAKKGQLPSFLGKLNRFQVPSVATYLVALAILTPLVIGVATASTFVIYILASTFTWVIGYIIAHVDLIVLRIKRPEIRGGFRTPLFPVPQLLSLAGLVWILFDISPDPALTRSIYTIAVVFLGISVVYAALWVLLKEKKGLFQTTPVADLVEDFDNDESNAGTPNPAAAATPGV